MKITDLKQFSFNIGNTISSEVDVIATNEGIIVNREVVSQYPNKDINNVSDLIGAIDIAIDDCPHFTDEDKEELGVALFNGADMNIKVWWKEKYD